MEFPAFSVAFSFDLSDYLIALDGVGMGCNSYVISGFGFGVL